MESYSDKGLLSNAIARSRSLQCLSAWSPIRTVFPLLLALPERQSSVPFGMESYSDRRYLFNLQDYVVSSVPFGMESYSDNYTIMKVTQENVVFSAFRHGVLFGP